MKESKSLGLWAVIGISFIFCVLVALSERNKENPISQLGLVALYIFSLIVLYILYLVILKLYPQSENWGIRSWIIVIIGVLAVIMIGLTFIGGFISGISGTHYQWETYNAYGISFSHPTTIPINTTDEGYSDARYYEGSVVFDNPDQQSIAIAWIPIGNKLSQLSIQTIFATGKQILQEEGISGISQGSIQEKSHSGHSVYYVTGNGIDTTDGKKGYYYIAIWDCPNSQRRFIMGVVSEKSLDDVKILFDGVLNSFKCH